MDMMDKKEQEDRRHADINERDIEYLEKSRNEEATAKQTMWSVRCFQSWCEEKKETVHFQSITKTDLNRILRQFYATVKNGKGEAYGFSSYVGIRAGLNRYINDPPISRSWCLIKDAEFTTSNNVFAGMVKKLRREGRDKSSHHQAITEADFQTIKHFQARSSNTPWGLVCKVWFDVQLHMGRRANEGNRKLKPDSFSIRHGENDLKYVTLSFDECTENHKDAAGKNTESPRGFIYEQPGNPLCPVASLEKYLSLLPPDPPAFYLHPKRTQCDSADVWYTREPMGVNFLAGMLPRICKAAGTEIIYTNHCLKSTTVQKLSDVGHEAWQIMSVTGHKFGIAMKRSSSSSSPPAPSRATSERSIKVSRNGMQALIQQEVCNAVRRSEMKLDCLVEKIQQMESEIMYESAIHKLEAKVNRVKRRGDEALAYIKTLGFNGGQDSTPEMAGDTQTKLDTGRSDSKEEVMEIVSVMTKMREEDNLELFKTMETTKNALKKMQEDSKALKAAIADISNELTPPHGSHTAPPRKKPYRLKQESDVCPMAELRKVKEEEDDICIVKVEHLPNENNTSSKQSERDELSYPPLPDTPFPSVLSMEATSYNIPQRMTLQLALIKNPPGLSLLWNVEEEDPSAPPMDSYSIFMTMEKVKGSSIFPEWKTLGEVASIPLPMCLMITNCKPGYKMFFAVVGKDKFDRYGPYSKVVPAIIPE